MAVNELFKWLKAWIRKDLERLSPADWFCRGHDLDFGYYDSEGFWRNRIKKGVYLWEPPPAAADAISEELRKARLKHTESSHFFYCTFIPSILVETAQ